MIIKDINNSKKNTVYPINPNVVANIVIHSISDKEFEVIDMNIEKECDNRYITDAICDLHPKINGWISKDLNTHLWEKFKTEMFHIVNVELCYATFRDSTTGEYDTDMIFEYELIKSSLEFNNRDFYKPKMDEIEKIYYERTKYDSKRVECDNDEMEKD